MFLKNRRAQRILALGRGQSFLRLNGVSDMTRREGQESSDEPEKGTQKAEGEEQDLAVAAAAEEGVEGFDEAGRAPLRELLRAVLVGAQVRAVLLVEPDVGHSVFGHGAGEAHLIPELLLGVFSRERRHGSSLVLRVVFEGSEFGVAGWEGVGVALGLVRGRVRIAGDRHGVCRAGVFLRGDGGFLFGSLVGELERAGVEIGCTCSACSRSEDRWQEVAAGRAGVLDFAVSCTQA